VLESVLVDRLIDGTISFLFQLLLSSQHEAKTPSL
jgi:hypothetical protein